MLRQHFGKGLESAGGVRGEGFVELFREAIRLKPPSHDLVPEGNGNGTYIRTMCQIGG